MVVLLYRPRRVDCKDCGPRVEIIPWAQGKSWLTTAMMCFLATWARRLSWREVARAFGVSWDEVCQAVTWVVEYGLTHRDLSNITALGVDEIQYRKGHKFLTLVYQIDQGCRRLLWIGKDRKERTLKWFFEWFGKRRSAAPRFVCSDMWRPYINVVRRHGRPYINVVRRHAGEALHVLDRFHVAMNLNKAVDETRRREAAELRRQGDKVTLKSSRGCLLKRPRNLTKGQRGRLRELLRLNLRIVRAYLLKEDFDHFWEYSSPTLAGKLPRPVVPARPCQPHRAHAADGPHPPVPPRAPPQLPPRPEGPLLRRRRGPQQQGPRGHPQVLRLPRAEHDQDRAVSYARPSPGAGVDPQICLMRRFFFTPHATMRPIASTHETRIRPLLSLLAQSVLSGPDLLLLRVLLPPMHSRTGARGGSEGWPRPARIGYSKTPSNENPSTSRSRPSGSGGRSAVPAKASASARAIGAERR
jgi:hypothetical protein